MKYMNFFTKKISSIKNKKYLSQLYISITIFSAFILVTSSMFLMSVFKSVGVSIVNEGNLKLLVQTGHGIQNMNSFANSYINSLYSTKEIRTLMYEPELSDVDMSNIMSLIYKNISGTSFVKSIYVYNAEYDVVYVVGPYTAKRKLHNFYDKQLSDIIGDKTKVTSLPFARAMPVSDFQQETINVYTYIMAERNSNNEIVRMLTVNIDVNWIFSSVKDEAPSAIGNVIILNGEGIIYGDLNGDMFLNNISETDFAQTLLKKRESQGFFVDEVFGEKSAVSFYKLATPDWICLGVTPYDYLMSKMNVVMVYAIIMCLALLCVVVLFCYYISLRLYSPVRKLVSNIAAPLGIIENKNKFNEFLAITENFNSQTNSVKKLQEFKQYSKEKLKSHHLLRLLTYGFDKIPTDESYEMNISFERPLMLCLIHIDFPETLDNKYSFHNNYMLKYGVINVITEIMSSIEKCECLDLEDDAILLILNESEAEDLSSLVKEAAAIAQDIIEKHLSLKLSFFIVGNCFGKEMLPYYFKQLFEMCKSKIMFGEKCIVDYEQFEKMSDNDFKIRMQLIEEITDVLEKGDAKGAMRLYDMMAISAETFNYDAILLTRDILLASVFKLIDRVEISSNLIYDMDYAMVKKNMEKADSLEAMRSEFEKMFLAVENNIKNSSYDKTSDILERALKYIRENYKDRNLNATIISDVFGVSHKYLSKLFNSIKKCTISEYIKTIRLEKAAELLRESTKTLDEIYDEIAWDNKKYFFTVFKKKYGMSPGDYRIKSKIENIE